MPNITTRKKKYLVPAIASGLLPGLGQLFKGHVSKAIGIFVIAVGYSIVSWLFGSWTLIGGVIGFAGFIGWLVNVIDAFMSSHDEKLIN